MEWIDVEPTPFRWKTETPEPQEAADDEFKELVFEVRTTFHRPMDQAANERFLDAFIEFIEARRLAIGFGVHSLDADGIVSAEGRGSPSADDRQAVLDWLGRRPEVASATAGDLVDGWYGWEDAT